MKNATAKSLLILDEIGRGTSTYDGMAIARAVLEHCAEKTRAKTLFATHYHELTELENSLPGAVNFSIAIKMKGDEITFLRKIVPGGADRSYGIEVAKLAGLPEKVLQRAPDDSGGTGGGEPCAVHQAQGRSGPGVVRLHQRSGGSGRPAPLSAGFHERKGSPGYDL